MNEVQKVILDIYIEVKKICEKHNLRYFAIGGTCLGAIRHQGFIPWDDDLDIAMPRDDYEKFRIIAKEKLPNYLQIYGELDGEHHICKFLKVHDVRTTFVESGLKSYHDRYMGAFIDIMPLDGIPTSKIERICFFQMLKQLSRLDWHRKFYGDTSNTNTLQIKEIIWKMIYVFIKEKPVNFYAEKFIELQKKYAFSDSRDLSYTWSFRAANVIFSRRDFDDYILMPFEHVQMRCPIGYDNFLKTVFGDYMKLPPAEKRVACHETDILDLERPYTYYIEKEK